MNKRVNLTAFAFLLSMVFGILIMIPQQTARAAVCYDPATKKPIPCPSSQKRNPTPTDLPPTLTFTPTATAVPSSTSTAAPTPTQPAAEVAVIATQPVCPSPVAALASNASPTQPVTNNGNGTPLLPWFMGGGGLVLGLAIGFFTGGVRGKTNVNGDGIVGPDRSWSGPVTQPGDLAQKLDKWQKGNTDPTASQDDAAALFIKRGGAVDMFHKAQDAGFADGSVHPSEVTVNGDGIVGPDKSWSGPITQTGDLAQKIDKWQKGITGPTASQDDAAALFIKRGDAAGAVDMFHKGQDAGFADGSVHPSTGNDAGMADGSVRPSDFIKKTGTDAPGENLTSNFDK